MTRPEMPDQEAPRCADSCGRVATDERLSGLMPDGSEVVELCCAIHASHPVEEEVA